MCRSTDFFCLQSVNGVMCKLRLVEQTDCNGTVVACSLLAALDDASPFVMNLAELDIVVYVLTPCVTMHQ